jgi:hypothetical protein
MAISQNKYVNITSGVGAATSVSTRALIARLFTTNALLPTGSFLEFTSASDVGDYFGTSSEEYARAAFYFGWVSKDITRPQGISFARWNEAASAPEIFGAPGSQSIATWNAISAGAFTLALAGTSHSLTAMDFTAAANLAAVAAIIQAKIRTQSGAMWTAATVTYDSVRSCFDFVGGVTGIATISVTAGTGGNDIAGQLGWLASNAIFSDGALAQSISDVLTQSADASDNFGSFLFMPALDQAQIVAAATWNLTQNNKFMYSVTCNASTDETLAAALADIGGVSITLSLTDGEYPEMAPMMILAATDYTARNSVQNYEFQIFNLTPSVTTDADYDHYVGLRINFYGQTQTAGQLLQFYQKGVMQGLPVDPADQNTYANEQWFKDAAGAAIMTILLALAQLPANSKGRAQILSVLQGVVDQALFNGTISPGKPLTQTQRLYITEQTGDPKAWYQVQSIGYWLDVVIVPYTEDSVTKYKAVYTLVYSKDDVIRLVEGRDILI